MKTICPACQKVSVMDKFTYHNLLGEGKIIPCGTDKIDGYEYCENHAIKKPQKKICKMCQTEYTNGADGCYVECWTGGSYFKLKLDKTKSICYA